MKDPVDGTATVVGYSEQHVQKGDDVVLNAQVMVQAEGLVPTNVNARPKIPQSWMPVKLGTEWPVRVDRAKPERLEFLFERVPGPAPPAGPKPIVTKTVTKFSVGTPSVQVMGGTPEQAKRAIGMAEQMMGMDLDGDGKVAGGPAPAGGPPLAGWFTPQAPAPADASDDPVDKLERLAKLLDAGDLTREEFEAQKKRILGSG